MLFRSKNHEISRRDILFSIMAKNLDDVYIMLSWGDWRKLYVSRNIERVLGLKNDEYSELTDEFKKLDKKGEIPDWNDITGLDIGESVVNEYWIKPADSNEYRLFKQGCYHKNKRCSPEQISGSTSCFLFILSAELYRCHLIRLFEQAVKMLHVLISHTRCNRLHRLI